MKCLSADAVKKLCSEVNNLDLTGLLEFRSTLQSLNETLSVEVYQNLGNAVLRLGEPLLAYDIIAEGRQSWPADVRLRQLLALALTRSGAINRAWETLQGLYAQGLRDEETLGLMARVQKDLALQATNPQQKKHFWQHALNLYANAYQQTGGYWTGINAATVARLLGEKEQALALATQVKDQCLAELALLNNSTGDRYWLQATLAEAWLIQENFEEAENYYTAAGVTAGARYGDLASTRRNAGLLMEALGLDDQTRQRLLSGCRIPAVVVFAGHMVDQPGRPRLRFPGSLEAEVARRLGARLEKIEARIGYASASCGSDILFLEAMLARQGEINIVLPFKPEAFCRTSVDIVPGADWAGRYAALLPKAARVIIASDNRSSGDEVNYAYANLLQDGLACLRANMLDTQVIPVVVWDGLPGDGPGGTASMVQHWKDQGLEPEVVDLAELLDQAQITGDLAVPALATRSISPNPANGEFRQEIRAILFADVVGYSGLIEEQIPGFVVHFMGAIHELIKQLPNQPLLMRTWGDALFCVFATIQELGEFALRLQDIISARQWSQCGLPNGLSLRISLHAGPVYAGRHPLVQGIDYNGSHITRAARIEPITPPGQVYASQQFAALASALRVQGFACDYVGQIPLPKKAGVIPLYLVRRA